MVCLSQRGFTLHTGERGTFWGRTPPRTACGSSKGLLGQTNDEGSGAIGKAKKKRTTRARRVGGVGWGDIKRRERRVVSTLLDGA